MILRFLQAYKSFEIINYLNNKVIIHNDFSPCDNATLFAILIREKSSQLSVKRSPVNVGNRHNVALREVLTLVEDRV